MRKTAYIVSMTICALLFQVPGTAVLAMGGDEEGGAEDLVLNEGDKSLYFEVNEGDLLVFKIFNCDNYCKIYVNEQFRYGAETASACGATQTYSAIAGNILTAGVNIVRYEVQNASGGSCNPWAYGFSIMNGVDTISNVQCGICANCEGSCDPYDHTPGIKPLPTSETPITMYLCTTEICGNNEDDDCDGFMDFDDPECQTGYAGTANAEAASYGTGSLVRSGSFNGVTLVLIPLGAVVLLRWIRRRK